ncbi:hypothetical protein PHYPSEUDO_014909 [Phytophthora pseudosyringae]|uniref:Uncharacterized protein n=1 Tax=Phytophthora pseudosyringae TaxID=221518 RepID=A0A8T1V4E3_9STRA|nr:hypothetical protein PHYPSEUDO_014909 [Phytophthora pseudosyringae]
MSTKEVRAIMMLIYGADKALSMPTASISMSKPEQNNALVKSVIVAQEERTAPNDDGYVTVDPRGEGNVVSNAPRLNAPVVMVSSAGYTLNTPENCSCLVELNDVDEELVAITSADDSSKCLVLNSYQQCVFGAAELALKFKTMVSSTGQLVLVESSTGCVLDTELQGDSKLVVCRNKYSAESQSWILCTVYELDARSQSPATSEMQHKPAISDATGDGT